MGVESLQSLVATLGDDDIVALSDEPHTNRPKNFLLIVDDEHCYLTGTHAVTPVAMAAIGSRTENDGPVVVLLIEMAPS